MDYPTAFAATLIVLGVVLVPGYAVSLALYPKKGQLDIIERLGISMIFGFLPSLIIYFLGKNMGIPLDRNSSTLVLSLVTVSCLGIYLLRARD